MQDKEDMEEERMIIVVTATRGNKSKPIKSPLERYSIEDRKIVEDKAIEIVNNKVSDCILGGAMGGDTIMLYYLLNHRRKNVPKLHVVVPVTTEFQPKETRRITRQADEIIELKQKAYNPNGSFNYGIYHQRNTRMFFIALFLECGYEKNVKTVAFWNGNKVRSGTWSTISMSRKKNIEVEIVKIGKWKE